MCKPNNTE